MFLAAFRNFENTPFSRNSIFSSSRRVSTTRICERFAHACNPPTSPTGTRSGCFRGDFVSGTTKQAPGPKPRKMTQGRTYQSPFPSCSVPTFTPKRHHHISRTVYNRGCSALVFFFALFHLSKFLSMFL